MYTEQDLPSQKEIRNDLFDFELKVFRRLNESSGVLNIEVDENYHPFDTEYINESAEDEHYEGFATGISFVTLTENEESFLNRQEDVLNSINRRFEQYSYELSLNYIQAGEVGEAIRVRNLTMMGAAEYAGKRYFYYLDKIRNGEVDPENMIGYSQDVINWMWAVLVFKYAA